MRLKQAARVSRVAARGRAIGLPAEAARGAGARGRAPVRWRRRPCCARARGALGYCGTRAPAAGARDERGDERRRRARGAVPGREGGEREEREGEGERGGGGEGERGGGEGGRGAGGRRGGGGGGGGARRGGGGRGARASRSRCCAWFVARLLGGGGGGVLTCDVRRATCCLSRATCDVPGAMHVSTSAR